MLVQVLTKALTSNQLSKLSKVAIKVADKEQTLYHLLQTSQLAIVALTVFTLLINLRHQCLILKKQLESYILFLMYSRKE